MSTSLQLTRVHPVVTIAAVAVVRNALYIVATSIHAWPCMMGGGVGVMRVTRKSRQLVSVSETAHAHIARMSRKGSDVVVEAWRALSQVSGTKSGSGC